MTSETLPAEPAVAPSPAPRSTKPARKPKPAKPGSAKAAPLSSKPAMVVIGAQSAGTGTTGAAPDTVEALHAGLALDTEYVEITVRRTKDGTFVVSSSATIDALGQQVALEDRSADAIAMVTGTPLVDLTTALTLVRDAGKKVHLDCKVTSSTVAYGITENTHEAALLHQVCAVLPADRFFVTSQSDASVQAMTAWAHERGLGLRIGLDLGRRPDGTPRVRLGDLYPEARVKKTGASLVVASPRAASLRLLDWSRDSGHPIVVADCADQPTLGRYVSDNRVWMVESPCPHLAPRHRAPSPPLLRNLLTAGALGVMVLLFLAVLWAVGSLLLGYDSPLPGAL